MARVKNNRKGIWSIGAWVVLPDETGILPNKEWADFKASVVGKAMLKDASLTEVEAVSKEDVSAPESASTASEDGQSPASLNATKAIELIKQTTDPDLLKQWQKAEKRTSVLQAIEAQLKQLEG